MMSKGPFKPKLFYDFTHQKKPKHFLNVFLSGDFPSHEEQLIDLQLISMYLFDTYFSGPLQFTYR